MNAQYAPLQKQADRLHYRVGDCLDDRSHPMADNLQRAAREVMECMESDRPPRSVEDRIKAIQQLLEHDSLVLSPEHAHDLHHEYEELRREVRGLPNY
jgi:predicted alpha/beta-fold hydrolase